MLRYLFFTACMSIFIASCKKSPQEESVVLEKIANKNIPPSEKSIVPPTDEARIEILKRAKTWVGWMRNGRSLLEGPYQEKKHNQFQYNQEFKCRFMEPVPNDPPGGGTPKFSCLDADGNDFKIKYQTDKDFNSGIFGEILSTRLFWALGFPADAVYPVKVICENCPTESPWRYIQAWYHPSKNRILEKVKAGKKLSQEEDRIYKNLTQPRGSLRIEDAIIEIKWKAPRIERYDKQGWSWKDDFDFVADDAELKAQREALALLAAFIQHADNKAEQQRLVCMDKEIAKGATNCQNPVMMIHDLGFTFGKGWILKGQRVVNGRTIYDGSGSTADLQGFLEAPLWSDEKNCITQVNYFVPTGAPANKKISEAGRIFLLEKLKSLSDKDLYDLFKAANVHRVIDYATKKPYQNSIEDWVKAFKLKVEKLEKQKCL